MHKHRCLNIFYQIERLRTAAVKTTAALSPRTSVVTQNVISPPQRKTDEATFRTSGRVKKKKARVSILCHTVPRGKIAGCC